MAGALEPPAPLVVTCGACGRRFKATGYDPAKPVPCPDCGGALSLATLSLQPDDGADISAPPPPDTPHAFPAPFGKYTLLRELGRGGMGVVFEALDTELQRVVALKTMRTRVYDDPKEAADDEERFLREARLCAALPKHPLVVTVFDMGAVDKRRYLAMEYIRGLPMYKWQRQDGMTLRRQVQLLREIALAIHHAHEHNVIHRDLKPPNVLVDERDRPHVTDFGLSKATSGCHSNTLTASGMLVGTPSYMSPEQARGEKAIDRRSDIYALGVMLYEIIAGRLPFAADSPIELLMKIVNEPVVPPSRLDPPPLDTAFDRRLESICLKAMAREAGNRHQTAEALAEDLARWLEETKGGAARSGTGKRLPFAIAGAAVLAAAVALAAWRPWDRGARDPAANPGTNAAHATGTDVNQPDTGMSESERAAADRKQLESDLTDTIRGEELGADRAFDPGPRPFRLDGVLTVTEGEGEAITIRVAPGTEIRGGRIDLRRRGRLLVEGTPDRPAILRDVEILQDHDASLDARHAVFERCTFRKGGVLFSRFSSRWTFECCLLFESAFERLDITDFGFRIRRCALVGMTLPEITTGKEDATIAAEFLRSEWTAAEGCAFADCTVAPSVFWCTTRCDFDGCRFPAWPPYAGDAAIAVEASVRNIDGAGPRERLAGAPPARAPLTVTIAGSPFETVRFPDQARCPVPELRHAARYRRLFMK